MNAVLLRETIEHSLGRWPIGALFKADQGNVMTIEATSISPTCGKATQVGLTIRAGGQPMVYFLFAWGGNEGHPTIAAVSNTLREGSSRPSLF